MWATTVQQCYLIAFAIAEGYQRECNEHLQKGRWREYAIACSKRDAASEIAQAIKHGTEAIPKGEG